MSEGRQLEKVFIGEVSFQTGEGKKGWRVRAREGGRKGISFLGAQRQKTNDKNESTGVLPPGAEGNTRDRLKRGYVKRHS